MDSKSVLSLCKVGNVEPSADECTCDVSYLLSVEPDVSLVVDAVEKKFKRLLREHVFRQLERTSVPPVLSAEVFRNGQVVKTIIRVRIDALVHQSPEYCSRYCRVVPVISHYLVSLAEFPAGSYLPSVAADRTQNCLHRSLGHALRELYRYR